MNDYRYNPFENVSTAVTITGETHVIPSVSPYTIRLDEVPLKETPSSISLTIAGSAGAEVSAAPASGEFWPDYSTGADSDDNWNTGTILFNSSDAGKTVVVAYTGTGTLVDSRATNRMAIFKTSDTWTCPPGVTDIYVSMCGGGGGGSGTNAAGSSFANGGNGGNSSLGSLLIATGGKGALVQVGGLAGGVGGEAGVDKGKGGDSLLGTGGAVGSTSGNGVAGSLYGAGGGGCGAPSGYATKAGGGGGGSRCYLRTPVTVTPDTQYTITIGAGGIGGDSTYDGGAGASGICIIEW